MDKLQHAFDDVVRRLFGHEVAAALERHRLYVLGDEVRLSGHDDRHANRVEGARIGSVVDTVCRR